MKPHDNYLSGSAGWTWNAFGERASLCPFLWSGRRSRTRVAHVANSEAGHLKANSHLGYSRCRPLCNARVRQLLLSSSSSLAVCGSGKEEMFGSEETRANANTNDWHVESCSGILYLNTAILTRDNTLGIFGRNENGSVD